MIPRSVTYVAGRICCTLGMLWAAAGAFKEIFGIGISLPFLPPLGLQWINSFRAMSVGLILYVVGSWLIRLADPPSSPPELDEDPGVTPVQLAAGFPLDRPPVSSSPRKDRV